MNHVKASGWVGVLATISVFGCTSSPDRDAATDASADAAPDGPADDGVPDAPTADVRRDVVMCPPALGTPADFVPGPRAMHAMDSVLRMNHLQAKATHNSYHVRPTVDVTEWAYTHVPLAQQFDTQGVRGVELDLNWNSDCQRLEVYHIALLDPNTTCRVFTDCLAQIRNWSAAHPGHHPLFIHIEPKFNADPATDELRMMAVEREILSVFSRTWIITPDEVRGSSATLAQAIMANGWPTLGQSRGRVLFYVDRTDGLRDRYTHGNRDLDGRLLFVDSRLGDPFAGVMVLNNPIGDSAAIRAALGAGFIVRTRADSNPAMAFANDRAQLDAALASGAQIVSTDFPAPVTGVPYSVTIPAGTPSRCSSVTAPMSCTAIAIEDPALLAR